MDIDDKRLILHHRLRRIENKLLKCYAKEVATMISQLVVKNCTGCIMENLSQTNHECLTMEKDEQLCMYFDEALSKMSEAKVTEAFIENLKDIKPCLDGSELLTYTRADWRCDFCTDRRRALKEETFKFL